MPVKHQLNAEQQAALRADLIEHLRLSHLLADHSLTGLGLRFKVSHVTIWRAARGDLDRAASSALAPEEIEEVKRARAIYEATQEAMEGYRLKVIAVRHNISMQTLYRHFWKLRDELGQGQPLSALWEAA